MEYYIEFIQLKVEGMGFHVSKSLCHLTKSEFTGPIDLKSIEILDPRGLGLTLKSQDYLLAWIFPLCIALQSEMHLSLSGQSRTVTSLAASGGASLAVCGQ